MAHIYPKLLEIIKLIIKNLYLIEIIKLIFKKYSIR